MVQLDVVRSANASFVQSKPLVAVFPGGTSGIGEYTMRALARHHGLTGRGLRVYIVGRNREAAENVIANCLTICPTGSFMFLEAKDLSLLKNVDASCEELKREEGKRKDGRIDLLVMTHAELNFGGRRETEEGLDKTVSLLYDSRMRFVVNLIPLLTASATPGHVVSVYGAGLEKGLPRWFPDDLSLRESKHYSLLAYRTHVPVMTTFFFEALAKQYEGKLALSHIFPGLVVTPAFYSASHPWFFKIAWFLVGPILKRFVALSHEESGERILFAASGRFPARSALRQDDDNESNTAASTDWIEGGGAYSLHYSGETNDIDGLYAGMRKEDFGSTICQHTWAAFAAIERGERFTG